MLLDLVKQNRSYRGFDKNTKITHNQLIELISHARLCSSGVNKQPIRYILSSEQEKNAMIFKHTNWAMALNFKVPFEGEEPTAYIIMCIDSKSQPNKNASDVDVGIAAQTILLAATEMGFGGCMIGAFNPKEVEKDLKIDDRYMVRLIIALGKPIENVVIIDCENGDTTYFRDENNTHYVPKLTLENIVLDF